MNLSRIISALVPLSIGLCFSGCAKRSLDASLQNVITAAPDIRSTTAKRININTASAKELEALPGIGRGLAARIVEHREKYGPFRRTEHLIIVRGISDARFRALRDSVSVE